MRVNASFAGIIGGTIQYVSNDTLSVNISLLGGGTFQPGVNWQVVGPLGVLASGTTGGGESNISHTVSITGSGGYTIVVSTSSSEFIPVIQMDLTGSSSFVNGSARGEIVGPVISPPAGFGMTLNIGGINPAGTIALVDGVDVSSNTPLQPPIFTWNFNGDTTNNPKTNFTSGLTGLNLNVAAGSSTAADARIDANST